MHFRNFYYIVIITGYGMSVQSVSIGGNTNACPNTKETWEARAEAKKANCGGQSVYHCLSDSEGRKWEKCVQRTLVISGYCPIFTSAGYIDWKPCNISDPSCPNSSFVSNEVYKYPGCYVNNTPKYEKYYDGVGLSSLYVAISFLSIIMFIFGAVLTFICRMSRGTKPKSLNHHDPESQGDTIALLVKEKDSSHENKHCLISLPTTLSRYEEKSILLLGSFGTLILNQSLDILRKFKEAEKIKWISMEYQYTKIPKTVEENTIMLVYGWFGSWNDDLCSLNAVKTACHKLNEILKKTNNVKVVIEMRSDLFRKYYQKLEEYAVLFQNECNLDNLNVHKEAEHKKMLQDKIIKLCTNFGCACNTLTLEMMQNDDARSKCIIGVPLTINVMAEFHDLISSYLDNKDIFEVMMNHISSLETDKKQIYEWIVYICLKGKYTPLNPKDKYLIKTLGFQINDSHFEESFHELSRYMRKKSSPQTDALSESPGYELCPFIYVCTFHLLYKKDPSAVITVCNIDAILQLVRPVGFKLCNLEVSANKETIHLFQKRLLQVGVYEKYKDHALFKPILASTV